MASSRCARPCGPALAQPLCGACSQHARAARLGGLGAAAVSRPLAVAPPESPCDRRRPQWCARLAVAAVGHRIAHGRPASPSPPPPRSALNAPCARAAAPGFSISRPPHRGHRHQSFPTWARMRLHPPAALAHRFFGKITLGGDFRGSPTNSLPASNMTGAPAPSMVVTSNSFVSQRVSTDTFGSHCYFRILFSPFLPRIDYLDCPWPLIYLSPVSPVFDTCALSDPIVHFLTSNFPQIVVQLRSHLLGMEIALKPPAPWHWH